MAGDLMGLLFGNKMVDRMRAQSMQDKLLADKLDTSAFDKVHKTDSLKRQHPTIQEDVGELEKLVPSALSKLLMLKGRNTQAEIDADVGLKGAQADYYKNVKPLLDVEGMDIRKANLERGLQKDKDSLKIKLLDKIGNLPEAAMALKDVEDMLGFDLDSYDPKTNTAMKTDPTTGKTIKSTINIPGISVKGIGRLDMFSGDAQQLSDARQRFKNLVLKERSGAAVVNNELTRYLKEVGEGQFNTEKDMLFAYKKVKDLLRKEMKSREAAFGNIAKEWHADGGQGSNILGDIIEYKPKKSIPSKTTMSNEDTQTTPNQGISDIDKIMSTVKVRVKGQ